ncbi:hypothetical protein IAU60_001806 [Kwoniella sp. DSM 27419]
MSVQTPLPQLTTTPPPADAPRRRFGSFNNTPSAPSGLHRQRPSSSSSTVSFSSVQSPTPALVPPPQPQRARSSSSASSTASAPVNQTAQGTGQSTPIGNATGSGQVVPAGFDITFAADKAQQWLSTWAPRGEGRGREFLNNTLNNVANVASTVTHNLNRDGFAIGGGSRHNSFVSTAPSGGQVSSASPSTSPEDRLGVSMSPPLPTLGHATSTPLLTGGQPLSSASNNAKKVLQPANLSRLGHAASTSAAPTTSSLSQQAKIGITNPSLGGSTASLPTNMPRSTSGTLTPTTGLHGPSHLNPNAQTGPSAGPGHRRSSSTASAHAIEKHRRSSSFGIGSLALSGKSPTISRSSSATARSGFKSSGMPYKIGFQPQGVRSDQTANYMEARRSKGEEREKEEGRLGRRWAKLVDLHFNPTVPSPQNTLPTLSRSSSSSFSLSTLGSSDRRRSLLSIDGALEALKPREVWKGLKGPTSGHGGEDGRKRTAEQAIVKWEDDGEVKKCRICQSSFSLSNRKHHCRLCGRIICSLPPTPPALLAVQIQLFAPSDPSATSTLTQGGLPPGTRREKCSLLLVADWKTGRGEEVEEGFVGWMKVEDGDSYTSGDGAIGQAGSPAKPGSGKASGADGEDRGKRRRGRASTASTLSTISAAGVAGGDEKRDVPLPQQPKEVQVKGVRACRDCWAVVSRKQKMQDRQRVNGFARLYQALRSLQAEIEELMPEYEDQLAELTESEEPLEPPPETLATHKTLLTLFAQYEHLSKRIGSLPCDEGGSQAIVQSAVARSSAGFLAKEMVKLQALQRLQKRAALAKRKKMQIVEVNLSDSMTASSADGMEGMIGAPEGSTAEQQDVALMLQPLLEQEAQLESYVADAVAQRKYEDSKALSEALKEIRAEIQRITQRAT